MIAQIVSEVFERIGHVWRHDTGYFVPTEDDVTKVLDSAAATLYDRDTADRFETGGLIIEKTNHGHDVYVYVGSYK